jgi:HEPN domain-containing protein
VNRSDLQSLSRIRLREARALLKLGFSDGAYYLAGYSIECGLKACVAKRTRRYDFPERDAHHLYTHAPRKTLEKAGIWRELDARIAVDPAFRRYWEILERWSPDSRYNVHSRAEAASLMTAVGDSRHGVLAWVKLYW